MVDSMHYHQPSLNGVVTAIMAPHSTVLFVSHTATWIIPCSLQMITKNFISDGGSAMMQNSIFHFLRFLMCFIVSIQTLLLFVIVLGFYIYIPMDIVEFIFITITFAILQGCHFINNLLCRLTFDAWHGLFHRSLILFAPPPPDYLHI